MILLIKKLHVVTLFLCVSPRKLFNLKLIKNLHVFLDNYLSNYLHVISPKFVGYNQPETYNCQVFLYHVIFISRICRT